MLDRQKLATQLDKVSKDLFLRFAKEQDIAREVWDSLKDDVELADKVHDKKYSLLLPKWQGSLNVTKQVITSCLEYRVVAVDGSQIYYDKHQGPACYLLNVGSVAFDYSIVKSSVKLHSQPHVLIISDDNAQAGSADFVNLQREEYEFETAWNVSQQLSQSNDSKPLVTLFDGSLIFFHLDGQGQDQKQRFLHIYFDYLRKFYDEKLLIAGYMSFPRSKELVNILKLVLAQFDEKNLENSKVLDQLTDMDVARYFLQPGQRSILFESKAPIAYAYPKELKPYFCYLHVGVEIVRLEFPAWIAKQEELVDQICQISYDQAAKGHGYPVCLFEAHEQAVVKAQDRDFFYAMIQKMGQKHDQFRYCKSLKSLKKQYVPV